VAVHHPPPAVTPQHADHRAFQLRMVGAILGLQEVRLLCGRLK
jgi:hypothetical protein